MTAARKVLTMPDMMQPPEPHHEWTEDYLEADSLLLDDSYQRPVSPSRLAILSKGFSLDLVKRLDVNRRPTGELYVMDGAHRLAAARNRGETLLPCRIYHFPTVEQEALFFVASNLNTNVVSALDRMKARIRAGDATAVAITAMLTEFGYEWNYSHGPVPGGVKAARAFEEMYNRSPDELYRVLRIASASWGRQVNALQDVIVWALSRFTRHWEGRYREDRLIAKLRQHEPGVLRQRAYTASQLLRGASAEYRLFEYITGLYDENLRAGRLRPREQEEAAPEPDTP